MPVWSFYESGGIVKQLMDFTARILIVTHGDGVVFEAAGRLNRAGLSTVQARTHEEAGIAAADFTVEGVVIDAQDRSFEDTVTLAKHLKAIAGERPLPILVVADIDESTPGEEFFASVLRPPVHPAQLEARLQAALRVALMEEEAVQRRKTVVALGQGDLQPGAQTPDAGALSILFVGAAAPQFIALKNALEQAGAEVTAAMTSFTAFDYLHDRSFDAIVLNALGENEPAFTIVAAMRRNTRLFHVPAILLVNSNSFTDVDEAYARGASDLLDASVDEADSRQRILGLARERQRHEQTKALFEGVRTAAVVDKDTGLFNPSFFARHLGRMTRRACEINRPLALAVIRAAAPPDIEKVYRESAQRQLGGMLRHLVRAEDMASRLGTGAFAIVMPGTTKAASQIAANRIESVIDCTAFESGNEDRPFQLELETRVVELRARESSEGLLQRALDED
ncbi:MAG: GGDEF domain-containing protein [Robiginitomaculum sp.]|nr:MAG: GGDEF domain-containing protein [Robiginitomaculum sp.]